MGKYDGEELQVGEDVKEIFNGIMSEPAEAVAEEAAAEAEAVAEEAAAEAEAVAEEAAAEAEAVAEEVVAEAEVVAEEAVAEAEAVAEEVVAEAEVVAEEVVAEEVVAEATFEQPVYDGYGTETVTYTDPAPAPAFDYGYSASQDDYTAAPSYTYNSVPQGSKGMSVAALVLGIVGFVLNPCYICSLLAIIFGGIGMGKNSTAKGMAIAGLICGIVSFLGQIVFDIIVSISTLGVGAFSFCC